MRNEFSVGTAQEAAHRHRRGHRDGAGDVADDHRPVHGAGRGQLGRQVMAGGIRPEPNGRPGPAERVQGLDGPTHAQVLAAAEESIAGRGKSFKLRTAMAAADLAAAYEAREQDESRHSPKMRWPPSVTSTSRMR